MADGTKRMECMADKPIQQGVAVLFEEHDLLVGMTYLFTKEAGIRLSGVERISDSTLGVLKGRGWVSNAGRLIDKQLGYSCYEYYRQFYRQEELDSLLIEEAAGRRCIVDVCCGGGATIFALLKGGQRERLCGIDSSGDQVKLLRELLEANEGYERRVRTAEDGTMYTADAGEGGCRIETRVGDAHRLPWEESVFDMVICRAALQYLNVKSAVREMHRVLMPGGKLFLLVHGSGYSLDYLVRRRRLFSPKTIAYAFRKLRPLLATKAGSGSTQGRYLTRRQLEKCLQEAGFGQIRYHTDKNRMVLGCLPVYFAVVAEKQGEERC